MSREKAKQLIALLGDRAESVLSLLSDENASYLRDEKLDPNTLTDIVIEDLFNNLQVSTVPETDTEPEIEETIELEEDLEDENFDFEEEDSVDTIDFDEPSIVETEESNFKPIADTLQEQDPALVAFFLKKLEEDKRDSIMTHMTHEFKDSIDQFDVKELPISNEIFEQLYNELFKDWN